jgi:hypothetical protein
MPGRYDARQANLHVDCDAMHKRLPVSLHFVAKHEELRFRIAIASNLEDAAGVL